MLRELLSAAMLLALAGPALAETATGQAPGAAGAGGGAPGAVKPEVEGASGQTATGGITKTAREIIPDKPSPDGNAAAVPMQGATGAGVPLDTAANRGAVSPEVVRELRDMALQAEKNAPKPPAKSQEVIAAEQRSIEAHRQTFFSR